MQRVGGPGDLPGAKVSLATLLVKVGEYEEEQQRHDARHYDHVDGNRFHGGLTKVSGLTWLLDVQNGNVT